MRSDDIELLCRELAGEVRELVRPHLGEPEARKMEGRGASGDSTFAIDEVAEKHVEKRLEQLPEVAYLSEDRGLVGVEGAQWVLIVDPIDGTRPAAAGLEACCVSIAASPYEPDSNPHPTLQDVDYGVVYEIKNDVLFEAVRGGGSRMMVEGKEEEMKIYPHKELSTLFWTLGFRGRPALPLALVLEELIDTSSVDGGLFDLGSATYCVTRLLTGQLDAYVDVGDRMLRDAPEIEVMFKKAGHGHVINNTSYDLAAVALIAREAGAAVTDAYGKTLEGYPLLASGTSGQLSCVAAVTPGLLADIIDEIDAGIQRMRRHYGW